MPSFVQTGGARLGWFNMTWPFARLSADREEIRLLCAGERNYVFPRQSIQRLSRHRGFFSVGLRIEHTVPAAPEFVVFWASLFLWTSGYRKLKARLRYLGYQVYDA